MSRKPADGTAVWMQSEVERRSSHRTAAEDFGRECHPSVIGIRYPGSVKRTERMRLYPTASQVARLEFALDVTRQLYNALLEERREAFRRRGVRITTKQQYAELTALRREDARIAAVYRECEDAVLHRLDLAFQGFFRRTGAERSRASRVRTSA